MIKFIMNIIKPKVKAIQDDIMEKVTQLLFPEPEEQERDGIIMVIDRSIDVNLQAVLVDLEDGVNDVVTRDTIKKCLLKLIEAREALEANNYTINKKARYLMVDVPDIKN